MLEGGQEITGEAQNPQALTMSRTPAPILVSRNRDDESDGDEASLLKP
jgi:hypothetical protein